MERGSFVRTVCQHCETTMHEIGHRDYANESRTLKCPSCGCHWANDGWTLGFVGENCTFDERGA